MKLTAEEFARIRPLTWQYTNVSDRVYQTTADAISTRLFWLDFLSLIFAPKFATQYGVPTLADFDVDQPVLMTDELELLLPTQAETAMYYADNLVPPFAAFSTGLSSSVVLSLALTAIAIVLALSVIVPPKWVPLRRIV